MSKEATTLDLREIIGQSKFIVVGDIHGCFDDFMKLLDKINYHIGDFVISVGDLVDRGPKSKEVLEWFRDTPNVFAAEGNHDNKARRYWEGRPVKIANGLNLTINQCKDMDHAALVEWIKSWPQIIRLPDINGKPTYVVHAGVDGNYPINQQRKETAMYVRFIGGVDFRDESGQPWYETLDGSYNVLSGHAICFDIFQPSGKDHVWLLDGGAVKGGELRALVKNQNNVEVMSVKTETHSKFYPDSIALREELVEAGYLRKDSLENLRIYTYTDTCVHDRRWDAMTLNSRGIIINFDTGEVVAQPFPKFFNVGEREDTQQNVLPWHLEYQVYEKMDGWLGILYRLNGQHRIATRGSFDGMGVAPWATELLSDNYDLENLPDEVTLVFEIISPQTKIIVDYHEEEKLVLTAAYNRHTGAEYKWSQVAEWGNEFGFELPRVFGNDIESCKNLLNHYSGKELEGFVIRFSNDLRVKIKSEDYKRRAAIVAHLTPLSLWRAMKKGKINSELRAIIDDDYKIEFNNIADSLEEAYKSISDKIWDEYDRLNKVSFPTRKEYALAIGASRIKHKSSMFALKDGKNISEYIMKLIKPVGNKL